MKIEDLYNQWCKETKRGGAILIGGSIREFFRWLEVNKYEIRSTNSFGSLVKPSHPLERDPIQ